MNEQLPQAGPETKAGWPAKLRGFMRRLYAEEAQAWRKHYKRYFKHAARALGAGFVIGFAYFMLQPSQEQKALELVMKALKDIPVQGPALVLALTIFYHNSRASLIAVAAGWVPFLFLPILDPLLNGAVLGLLVSVSKHHGLDVVRLVLTQILPHGVFELAAVLYAASLGLYLSAETGKRILAARRRRKQRRQGLSFTPTPSRELVDFLESYPERKAAEPESLAWNALRSFVLVVLPLLLLAAFIEGFITPRLG